MPGRALIELGEETAHVQFHMPSQVESRPLVVFMNPFIAIASIAQSFAKQSPVPDPPVGIAYPPDVYHAKNARTHLELVELLDLLASSGQHAKDVESDLVSVSMPSR